MTRRVLLTAVVCAAVMVVVYAVTLSALLGLVWP